MMNKPKVSEDAAINLLKRLFSPYPDKNAISIDEVYSAAGRSHLDPTTNRNWLNGILAKLKAYQLAFPVLKYDNGRNKLNKVQLTTAGKVVLNRSSSSLDSQTSAPILPTVVPARVAPVANKPVLSLDEMLEIVEALRVNHPNWDIVFEIKPKGGGTGGI